MFERQNKETSKLNVITMIKIPSPTTHTHVFRVHAFSYSTRLAVTQLTVMKPFLCVGTASSDQEHNSSRFNESHRIV